MRATPDARERATIMRAVAMLPILLALTSGPGSGSPPPTAGEPGAIVWRLDETGEVSTRFGADDPCPLARVQIDPMIYTLDRAGRIAHVDSMPAPDPALLMTRQPTPFGELRVSQGALALVDPATGATRWQLTYETPISQPYGQSLERFPAIAYAVDEHYVVLWRCTLDGTNLPGDAVFLLDVATGAWRKVTLVGLLGRHCLIVPGGFVALMMPDRNAGKRTFACYDTSGKRRWWRTVGDGTVSVVTGPAATSDAAATPAIILVMQTAADDQRVCRPLLIDAITGRPQPRPELPPLADCIVALSPAGDRFALAGRRLDRDHAGVLSGVAQVATGLFDWTWETPSPEADGWKLSAQRVGALAFAPGGTTLALLLQEMARDGSERGELRLFEQSTGRPTASTEVPGLGHRASVAEFRFLANAPYLLVRDAKQASLFAAP